MIPHEFYATHSMFTNPGQYRSLFDQLPSNIESLCEVVRGLYIHYMGGSMVDYQIPANRMGETDLRYTEAILAHIIKLDSHELTYTRPPHKRFVGCCRDSALLLCAMLRHKSIPARVRVGFANYFRFNGENFYTGHVVTEYWNSKAQTWKLVDPEQSAAHIAHNRITFDVHDLPRNRFLVGGKAWQLCRHGEAAPENFGVVPGDFMSGWWFLRNRVFHELAYHNKVELLLWDTWNWMEPYFEPSEDDLRHIDNVTLLTQNDSTFDEMRAFYLHDPYFRTPDEVMSYSPTGDIKKVNWKRDPLTDS